MPLSFSHLLSEQASYTSAWSIEMSLAVLLMMSWNKAVFFKYLYRFGRSRNVNPVEWQQKFSQLSMPYIYIYLLNMA